MSSPALPLVVIPARLAARRLPDKPLADILGVPMIVHVWRRAAAAGIGRTVVAAAEPEIAEAVTAAGGEAVLTDPALPSGSDRVWQAVERLDPQEKHDLVVNVQGDLPTLDPALVVQAAALMADPEVDIATLAVATDDPAERDNPNVVKAVVALPDGAIETGQGQGRALYFTRSPSPSGDGPILHHIGLYAFRRAALRRFVALPPSPLERRERLEQLRALEAGLRIEVGLARAAPFGVDTPDDLERARHILAAAG